MADKNYISQAFQDRIEVSLANISRNSDDEFELVKTFYVPRTFKCELCGHEPCLYAFTIRNIQEDKELTVGSECVKHFKNKGIDIDVASGLKKRVKRVVRKMRKLMKRHMDEDEYKDLSREHKRELTIRLFMQYQTKELIRGENKKVILSKEDVLRIVENPEALEDAKKTKKAIYDRKRYLATKKKAAKKSKTDSKSKDAA
jgi:hypothetical protein